MEDNRSVISALGGVLAAEDGDESSFEIGGAECLMN